MEHHRKPWSSRVSRWIRRQLTPRHDPRRQFVRDGRLRLEALEPRQMLAADDLYYVSGSPSTNYTVRLTKTGGGATFNNELNVFVVDDYTGAVNGVAPGYNSYFNAVKSLAAGVERWTAFTNQTPNNTTFDISVPGGTYLSFSRFRTEQPPAPNPPRRGSPTPAPTRIFRRSTRPASITAPRIPARAWFNSASRIGQ